MNNIAKGVDQFESFARDAKNVDASDYVVFIAVVDNPVNLPDCGICGHKNCEAAKAFGAPCAFNLSDLGTAASSACVVASNHFVDNRLMYTAGKAVKNLGLFDRDIRQCYGIPISASGKSIYFDRK
jgi:uncharacterized ferredoxin-like protein